MTSNALTPNVKAAVETLWRYNRLRQRVSGADLLIVLGTNDIGVADHAADIALRYRFKHIVCAGGIAHKDTILASPFGKMLAKRMEERGVTQKIFCESASENTGDNFRFTHQFLANAFNRHANTKTVAARIKTGVIATRPPMERRALATAQRQWPDPVAWRVTSNGQGFDTYSAEFGAKGIMSVDEMIHCLVGDTYRLLAYVDYGFVRQQHMPKDVFTALKHLIHQGYTKRIGLVARDLDSLWDVWGKDRPPALRIDAAA
jgi:uncharacterized SAM-binding protein YcdF (DUF218 family)